MLREADPVPEQRPTGEWAGGVDGEDSDATLTAAQFADQRPDQRALADAGRPGETDHPGGAGARVELRDQLRARRITVLDQRDGSRECALLALEEAVGEV